VRALIGQELIQTLLVLARDLQLSLAKEGVAEEVQGAQVQQTQSPGCEEGGDQEVVIRQKHGVR